MTEDRERYHAGEPDLEADPFPAVMTVEQVAAFLQVSKRTIYNMAQAGELPAVKVGEQWRFYRPELDRWLSRLSRAHVGEPVEPEGEAE